MIQRDDDDEVARAERAARDLFALAVRLGGAISGEHGIGLTKQGHLADQLPPAAVALHHGIKALFDPAGLMNPGKKR
jgi:glycolate oxidase